ncbi:EamA family transporter RarD [Luteococcus peritonei]|uniref:EamA family transporter RarD n=1 Tax=Luteococcus peritonei TaxID=88874 RepID=A0ABW4RYF6_9ACTN
MSEQVSSRRTALAAGFSTYLMWGAFPLFFPLLKPAGALEILSGRVLFSLVFVVAVLLLQRKDWGWLRAVFRDGTWRVMLLAAALIAVNWLTYIWAVNSGHVVEASLGYFINPLVSVALGMLVFGERMGRPGQIGCLLALLGVAVAASEAWRTVWISLLLAVSFGLYGVVKKHARVTALQGLAMESGLLAPLSLGWMGWLAASGSAAWLHSPRVALLLVVAGVLTAVPLWLFAVAAPGIPLGTLGILQYITPTIQFLLGLFVFGQHVGSHFWVGLVLVWCGSVTYLYGALRSLARPA